ncbi:ABC transporter ATP-binding protein [Nitrosopumilus sp.]|jgi:lipopolysaccharide transport system ATP-binding protein|nr:ABC transporter ATP-binding protein [Nitrosopumilus sp.]
MSENSVNVKNISKKFRLYHEKRTTIYESITGSLNRKPHYEILQVLDDVSFNVKKGESFGIVGRNGSGKTTLLRILSNIYQPDSGSVETNGIVIPVLALGLGFHPDLTAITNIYQSSILLGISKNQIKEKIDDIIKFAELEKFADTKLKNFSSGMQMRLAFATAVQVDPAVLLLDEVIAVGDINFQKKCRDVMLDFKKRGKSIVLVSHGPSDIEKFCDRAMFLKEGKIEILGKPTEVIDSYKNYMNKLPK